MISNLKRVLRKINACFKSSEIAADFEIVIHTSARIISSDANFGYMNQLAIRIKGSYQHDLLYLEIKNRQFSC